jgi:DNA-binding FrmR family transcriptional regulator
MSHVSKNKKQLLTRIRRIKGQTEAMEKALNDDVDCAAIMQQVASIRGAVNGLMTEVLEEHIREHLGVQNIELNKRQEDIEQVITALRSYLK